MKFAKLFDGVHNMVPEEKMSNGVRKIRSFYELKPDAPIYQAPMGYYSLDRWKSEGNVNDNTNLDELFKYDEKGYFFIDDLGWVEPPFYPAFEEKVIEDRGKYEVVQDKAGRFVLFFKGRRNGFMPEYLDHPVRDMKTWEENCKWRLNPKTAGRYNDIEERMKIVKDCASKGKVIEQLVMGGYMYLRSLMGPLGVLCMFYDDPALIHECMKTWLSLSDAVVSENQKHVTLDELYIGEDICYNHGSLISPDMIKEFLFPYYQQLIENTRSRQIDKNRHLYFRVDTDGFANPVIPLYISIGMDVMSPFEVASGCDVVEIGLKYPCLRMIGGFDKRILAQGKDAIDMEIERIMPVMKKRGGYIPECDHGVPEEVSFENFMHFRKRLKEYAE